MIISTPRPEPPSQAAAARRRFWRWFNPLLADGQARWIYARPGRGAVALFDAPDHAQLHRLLNQWAERIPATFEIHPLLEAAEAQAHLAPPRRASPPRRAPQGANR
ncbi:MAG: DUF3303 family protein [Burkholderiales bacterium]|nr:DUF3303 family protein [Burkholderiales bacterium]